MTQSSERVHATCVAVGGRGVLIEGPSGSGKSDLALRLVDRGALLVSDDQTLLVREGAALVGSAPATIAGRIEVRGLGVVSMPAAASAPVALIVNLSADVPRMPLDGRTRRIAGIDLPVVALAAFEASAPIKVELALQASGRAA